MAVATGALGGNFFGGGGTPPGSKGGGYKRIRSLEASFNEDINGDNSLSFNFPAPVRYSPNTFVFYNSFTFYLLYIGEEKKRSLGKP